MGAEEELDANFLLVKGTDATAYRDLVVVGQNLKLILKTIN